MSKSSRNGSSLLPTSEKYCIEALLFLSGAIFFLSVVVFTFNPTTIPGLIATGIGVVLMVCSIVRFVGYHSFTKKEERERGDELC